MMKDDEQEDCVAAALDARVLVVGAGSSALGLNIARLLMESGAKVVMVADVAEAVRVVEDELPEIQIPLVVPRPAIDQVRLDDWAHHAHPPPHGWYQQFAGRRGRPPRY
ncbi:hypothetical protein WJ96_05290 [Burkholderia ubonensis]|uniref:SDR family NAD(P)-dependent oxidoreductase n=1 Tax=Burkholderia ubonensis TaxID=101571 RepID=A0AAW3MXR0_9BURK|nr:hypothetical protein [Burkholderia ubonensis]KVP97986.1 hypothetical protein WJ96_05290 [Burkholderia ubonensis]KVZ92684.1 hypothetical protein WL25_16950 [Burkholderia ubonensis]